MAYFVSSHLTTYPPYSHHCFSKLPPFESQPRTMFKKQTPALSIFSTLVSPFRPTPLNVLNLCQIKPHSAYTVQCVLLKFQPPSFGISSLSSIILFKETFTIQFSTIFIFAPSLTSTTHILSFHTFSMRNLCVPTIYLVTTSRLRIHSYLQFVHIPTPQNQPTPLWTAHIQCPHLHTQPHKLLKRYSNNCFFSRACKAIHTLPFLWPNIH